ncbi:MAG: hypothetical protein JWO02_4665 [Solirubrobacterales bacterium]|nr:hypothetical protein [Solirubrobacterales bacterium]
MFLVLGFGLFLASPLILLAGSVGRTAVTASRGTNAKPLTADTTVVAGRLITSPVHTTVRSAVSKPIGAASLATAPGTLLAFRPRQADMVPQGAQYGIGA